MNVTSGQRSVRAAMCTFQTDGTTESLRCHDAYTEQYQGGL